MKQTVLKEYIRDKNNNPCGVVVAVKDDDQVFYGYSLCNPSDKYDKRFGMNIAINRALSKDGYSLPHSPQTIKTILGKIRNLESRALLYFKDIKSDNIRFDYDIQ